jgi:hypothetical protein
MSGRKMRRLLPFILLFLPIAFCLPSKSDFGDADFPVGMFDGGPKSYHDAWCGKIGNKCRVVFNGPAMMIEGQGGIQTNQYIGFRYDEDGNEYYNYISYMSSSGVRREALFLFANRDSQRDFVRAFSRWKTQNALPIPNYRLPNSQGPQDTQGRDKGLNPYSR